MGLYPQKNESRPAVRRAVLLLVGLYAPGAVRLGLVRADGPYSLVSSPSSHSGSSEGRFGGQLVARGF